MMYILIEDGATLDSLVPQILGTQPSPIFADLETTGLDFFVDNILLFQMNYQGRIYIADIRKIGLESFANFLRSTQSVKYVFHNAKFDMKFILSKTGILLQDIFDTMNCEVILNAGNGHAYYSLSQLVEKYTDYFLDKEERSSFIGMKEDTPFTEAQLNYSAFDVLPLPEIYEKQWIEVDKVRERDIIEMEMKLIPVVTQMEINGICIDTKKWLEIGEQAKIVRDDVEREFIDTICDEVFKKEFANGFELANAVAIPVKTMKLTKALTEITEVQNLRSWLKENFNVNSSKQMTTVLNLIGIKVPNTNAKTILDHVYNYPILEKLLQLRELGKQVSSYGVKFLEHVNSITGKIHTEYRTSGTQTGRFSSNKPNMQQIPRIGGYRECFVPSKDYVFASLDYSQQEYRLAGAISGEPTIIEAYINGYDMHSATGAIVSGKKIDEISKDDRNLGKTLNFAILYGSTEFGIKHNLKISLEKAQDIINTFWSGYPYLKAFNDLAGERILELGYSSTPMGRRRYNLVKPLFLDSKGYVKWKERVLREGINLIIQGGGADILKLAMINIFNKNPYGDKLRILLQIHDELLVEVHESIKEEAFEFIKKEMEDAEQPFLGKIPAVVEGEIKDRWSK